MFSSLSLTFPCVLKSYPFLCSCRVIGIKFSMNFHAVLCLKSYGMAAPIALSCIRVSFHQTLRLRGFQEHSCEAGSLSASYLRVSFCFLESLLSPAGTVRQPGRTKGKAARRFLPLQAPAAPLWTPSTTILLIPTHAGPLAGVGCSACVCLLSMWELDLLTLLQVGYSLKSSAPKFPSLCLTFVCSK